MSFSSLVIGAVAVVMMILGGSAVSANTMTLGDFLMYISFTFLLAMPVFELTAIGTQDHERLRGRPHSRGYGDDDRGRGGRRQGTFAARGRNDRF